MPFDPSTSKAAACSCAAACTGSSKRPWDRRWRNFRCRNYNTVYNLKAVLDRVDTHEQDVVVLHLRFLQRTGAGEYELAPEQLFSLEEQKLFTRASEISEKKGRTIHLAVAAPTERWDAIVRAAQSLRASTVVLGRLRRHEGRAREALAHACPSAEA